MPLPAIGNAAPPLEGSRGTTAQRINVPGRRRGVIRFGVYVPSCRDSRLGETPGVQAGQATRDFDFASLDNTVKNFIPRHSGQSEMAAEGGTSTFAWDRYIIIFQHEEGWTCFQCTTVCTFRAASHRRNPVLLWRQAHLCSISGQCGDV